MREIKFRIYDKELKEAHIVELQELCEDDYWYDGETGMWSVLADCNNKQERFIALQYTGLEDENNYEIYEGDIVKYRLENHQTRELYYENFVVEWNKETASYTIKNATKGILCIDYVPRSGEVIGDIYNNPELIDAKEGQHAKDI